MPPPLSTLTPVIWQVQTLSVGSRRLSIARLSLEMFLRYGQRHIRHDCWLDTGAPLSVIPLWVHKHIAWSALGLQSTWAGLACAVGTVDVWLPTSNPGIVRGPIALAAKFPVSDPPGQKLPILLGLEFLLSHGASLTLPPPPAQGEIHIP
jgi:hypothetical protein